MKREPSKHDHHRTEFRSMTDHDAQTINPLEEPVYDFLA